MRTNPLAVLVVLVSVHLAHCSKKVETESLPPKGKAIADFNLYDQDGRHVTLSTLSGHVWVASFVFTTCPSICPEVTKAVGKLQETLKAEKLPTKLVTLTVDPEIDTPPVLRDYGIEYGADFDRWRFLTSKPDGSKQPVDVMREVVEGNFKTVMGEKKAQGAGMYDIAHTTKLVLIDQEGYHRGYFSMDDNGRHHLVKAVKALTKAE